MKAGPWVASKERKEMTWKEEGTGKKESYHQSKYRTELALEEEESYYSAQLLTSQLGESQLYSNLAAFLAAFPLPVSLLSTWETTSTYQTSTKLQELLSPLLGTLSPTKKIHWTPELSTHMAFPALHSFTNLFCTPVSFSEAFTLVGVGSFPLTWSTFNTFCLCDKSHL